MHLSCSTVVETRVYTMADLRIAVLLLCLCLTLIKADVVPLDCDLKKQFIDLHNSLRLKVAKGEVNGQPAASRMTSLVWDEELAKKADYWVRKNSFSHNPDRTVPSNRFNRTGENLHFYGTTKPNPGLRIESGINSWFDEHKNFTYKPLTAEDFDGDRPIEHYTQLVWEKTHYVGCALTRFLNVAEFNTVLIVCNYGPAGNVLGEVPYPSGMPSNKLVCGAADCSRPYGKDCPKAKPDWRRFIFQ